MMQNKQPLVTCDFVPNFSFFMVGFLHRLYKVAANDLKPKMSQMQHRNTVSPCRLVGVDPGLV